MNARVPKEKKPKKKTRKSCGDLNGKMLAKINLNIFAKNF